MNCGQGAQDRGVIWLNSEAEAACFTLLAPAATKDSAAKADTPWNRGRHNPGAGERRPADMLRGRTHLSEAPLLLRSADEQLRGAPGTVHALAGPALHEAHVVKEQL